MIDADTAARTATATTKLRALMILPFSSVVLELRERRPPPRKTPQCRLEEIDERTGRPVNESERRKYYRITRAGRKVVAAETQRLADLVRVARSRIKPRTGESS